MEISFPPRKKVFTPRRKLFSTEICFSPRKKVFTPRRKLDFAEISFPLQKKVFTLRRKLFSAEKSLLRGENFFPADICHIYACQYRGRCCSEALRTLETYFRGKKFSPRSKDFFLQRKHLFRCEKVRKNINKCRPIKKKMSLMGHSSQQCEESDISWSRIIKITFLYRLRVNFSDLYQSGMEIV